MKYKILVVDDEPDLEFMIRQIFIEQIYREEYEFVFAQNGVEAIEKLRNNGAINLLLTDINMPEMDGLTLLSRIKEINPYLKSIVISAYGDSKNIQTARQRGASDFITKPIDIDGLEVTIKKSLQAAE